GFITRRSRVQFSIPLLESKLRNQFHEALIFFIAGCDFIDVGVFFINIFRKQVVFNREMINFALEKERKNPFIKFTALSFLPSLLNFVVVQSDCQHDSAEAH
ncbi:hypothetical protein, partial [Duncaniella muris]